MVGHGRTEEVSPIKVGEKGAELSDEPGKLYPIGTEWKILGYAYDKELAEAWAVVARGTARTRKEDAKDGIVQ